MGPLGAIESLFRERFERLGIRLPAESLEQRRGGHLFHRGWHIGYGWGEERGEVYLDVLSQHRMTDDDAERLWASGRADPIETAGSMYMVPGRASEAERRRIGQEHAERTAQISADLRRRGLLPPAGENLPSLEINEYLRSGGTAQCDRED